MAVHKKSLLLHPEKRNGSLGGQYKIPPQDYATTISETRPTYKSDATVRIHPYNLNHRNKAKATTKICQITGKKAMVGNNVSHSKRRTKRTFDVNLFYKKFYYVEQDCWISLRISAAGLRLINKIGLDAALCSAVAKGYCDWKEIKVIG